MTTPRAVLFDWDGTMLDSAEASYRCYVRLFSEFGIPFGRAEYQRTYSPDWYHTFRCVGLSEDLWADAERRWLSHFAEEQLTLAGDVHDALDRLDRYGITKAIVTSGSRSRVTRELVAHGIDHHFEHVVCGTDVEQKKPHPAALQLCLARLGVSAEKAAYIGDSPEDVLMARAANVFSIAIRGAYPNVSALEAAKPDRIADNLTEAVDWLVGS